MGRQVGGIVVLAASDAVEPSVFATAVWASQQKTLPRVESMARDSFGELNLFVAFLAGSQGVRQPRDTHQGHATMGVLLIELIPMRYTCIGVMNSEIVSSPILSCDWAKCTHCPQSARCAPPALPPRFPFGGRFGGTESKKVRQAPHACSLRNFGARHTIIAKFHRRWRDGRLEHRQCLLNVG